MPFLQQYNYGQLAGRSPASPVAAPVMPVIHVFLAQFLLARYFREISVVSKVRSHKIPARPALRRHARPKKQDGLRATRTTQCHRAKKQKAISILQRCAAHLF